MHFGLVHSTRMHKDKSSAGNLYFAEGPCQNQGLFWLDGNNFFLSLCLARNGNRELLQSHDEKIYPRESQQTLAVNISSPSPLIAGINPQRGSIPV